MQLVFFCYNLLPRSHARVYQTCSSDIRAYNMRKANIFKSAWFFGFLSYLLSRICLFLMLNCSSSSKLRGSDSWIRFIAETCHCRNLKPFSLRKADLICRPEAFCWLYHWLYHPHQLGGKLFSDCIIHISSLFIFGGPHISAALYSTSVVMAEASWPCWLAMALLNIPCF